MAYGYDPLQSNGMSNTVYPVCLSSGIDNWQVMSRSIVF